MKIPTLLRSTLLLGLAAGLTGCDGPTMDDHEWHASGAAGRASAASARPATTSLGEESVYQLRGGWRDRNGDELELSDLAGRPQVLAFVYTSCTFACPRIVARMKRIEEVAGPDSDVGFVLVSIDPERDTPERLAHFAEGSRLDAGRWTLLNGGPDRLLELSVLLGVKYRSAGPGQLAHDNALVLLDRTGVPVARVDGLDAELGPILERVAPGARTSVHGERAVRAGDAPSEAGPR